MNHLYYPTVSTLNTPDINTGFSSKEIVDTTRERRESLKRPNMDK